MYALAIFETIKKDEDGFEAEWVRFRDIIMKPGGSRPANELLTEFFGEELTLRDIVQRFGAENI